MKLSSFFDKTYVISLPHDQKKRHFLSEYLSKHEINFQFIDAVDGNIDYKIIKTYNDYLTWDFNDPKSHPIDKKYKRKSILGPGAIGLLQTYKKVFTDAIANKYKYILVFEEDVLLSKSLETAFNRFIKRVPDFNLIFFGASQYAWKSVNLLPVVNSVFESDKHEKDLFYYYASSYTYGTFAMGYNCKVLPDILKCIEKQNCPIDSGCIACEVISKNPDSCYVLYPNQVIADTTNKSNISLESRNLRYHREKVKWRLDNIDFDSHLWKVSLLVANYNSSKTILSTLNSVASQTYKNLEIVIVDDHSTDDSVSIIEDFIKSNPRIDISLIRLQENIGAYGCRNIAFKKSTGFFITLLDSDDLLLPNKISNDIHNYFNCPECKLFFSKIYRSNTLENSSNLSVSKILDEVNKERKPYEHLPEERKPWNYRIRFGIQTIFADREFFEKYGLWRSDYRYGMDIDLIQRYLYKEYKTYINYRELWGKIYRNKAQEQGIFLADTLGLISHKMNYLNATMACRDKEREDIHLACEKDFLIEP